jgi:hypothetical protein
VSLRREIADANALLTRAVDAEQQGSAARRLACLRARLDAVRGEAMAPWVESEYAERILARMENA